MTDALERATGQLLLVVLLEVLFVVLVVLDPTRWYDGRWAALVAFGLGGLGLPWTLPVPYLVTSGGAVVPVVLLLVAPVANLALRLVGYVAGAHRAARP